MKNIRKPGMQVWKEVAGIRTVRSPKCWKKEKTETAYLQSHFSNNFRSGTKHFQGHKTSFSFPSSSFFQLHGKWNPAKWDEMGGLRTGTGGWVNTEHTRMPFGRCNAPGTIKRVMNNSFRDLNCQILLEYTYLEDILEFGKTNSKQCCVVLEAKPQNLKLQTRKGQ